MSKNFTRLRLSFYSMSCGPQLSGAIRKVTLCHPPPSGGDDTVPAAYAYTFSPPMQALRACMGGVKSGIYLSFEILGRYLNFTRAMLALPGEYDLDVRMDFIHLGGVFIGMPCQQSLIKVVSLLMC